MSANLSISTDGKIKITSGPTRTRLENIDKWLARNRDAILVKLEGDYDTSMTYKPGHLCRIEEGDQPDKYNVFVGDHLIGQLPDEAIAFANQINYSPEIMVSIVGKIENDEIFIYVAE